MKKSFDIKYKESIISGKTKVITRDGREVKIILWDSSDENYPIVGIIRGSSIKPEVKMYTINGRYNINNNDSVFDLFVLIDNPFWRKTPDIHNEPTLYKVENDYVLSLDGYCLYLSELLQSLPKE
jgi:hypothetical protein